MAEATPKTVLGNFDNSTFEYNGVTSRFFIENDLYKVSTDNSEGKLETFDISYTFGWEPLQQYLIRFDDGRMQTLSIAWDSRPADKGGQRWFHLYPDESVHADDVLHWTRFGMNWNTNCAECHSTNLEKNYEPATNTFDTTWAEVSVGCEACHGPASEHISWSKNPTENHLKGFEYDLLDAKQWARALDQDTAAPLDASEALPSEQEVCASCHSRRFKQSEDQDGAFFNNHQIQLIEPGLYHPDGQILDEVYVFGSFAQSKMHSAGVTCSNCHNPHNAQLKAPGDAVCLQCHSPETFLTTEHHLHPIESDGARCVNCHMPETTYMVVDPRRDHSIRIPRPDLDTPNACNQCHIEETSEWAAAALKDTHGSPARNTGQALAGIWSQDQNSLNRLFRVIGNNDIAPFVKSSAVNQLGNYADQRAVNAAASQLNVDYAPLRIAAVNALANLPLQNRFQLLYGLLDDENPRVRQLATASLSDIPIDQLPEDAKQRLSASFSEYERSLKSNLDSPGIATQLGNYYGRRGQIDNAVGAYKQANVIEPKFIPALLNLADLYRLSGDEESARATLLEAEKVDDTQPDVKYALGLAHIRSQNRLEAVNYFQAALELAPGRSDYRYAWVLSLFETGSQAAAIKHTLDGLEISADDQQLLYTLGYFYEQTGENEKAVEAYKNVLTINPNHQGANQQLRVLTN